MFTAKVEQARTKDNPPGWLRNALDGYLADPIPTTQPPPERAPQAILDARAAAGSLYGMAVNGQPMSHADAVERMRRMDDVCRISENLNNEARSLLKDAVATHLQERGHAT